VTGLPLAQEVLDVGHDDYYAHDGAWPDLQDSLWLRHLDAPQVRLTVALAGGAGRVAANLPGVDCTADCGTDWDAGTKVTLTATPERGTSRFVGWRGASCSGRGDCDVTLAQATAVTADFGPATVPVRVATSGRGRVVCSPSCSSAFRAGDTLRLRAVPARGWRFAAWGGACSGSRPVCSPATDAAVSARATFRRA
jgi:hypothetical protein